MQLKKLSLAGAVSAIIFTSVLGGCASNDDSSSSNTSSSSSVSSSAASSESTSEASSESSIESSSSATSTESTGDILTEEVSLGDCENEDEAIEIACAANAWLATLDSSQLETASYDFSDATARTTWSNLPTTFVPRNGLGFGAMSDESKTAALVLAKAALSDAGYENMISAIAADQYLLENGSGPMVNDYGKDLYFVAVFGTPDAGNDWAFQIGGHHLAFNLTYLSGTGYPTPHHIGSEPKGEFTVGSETYDTLGEESAAFLAMYDALTEEELGTAFLTGQTFGDVVMGPDDGSGTMPTGYPEAQGLLVSDLTEAQQDLVKAAIASYAEDYSSDVSASLMEAYTSEEALAQTYIAWAGTQSAGVDVDVEHTYMRIDGPRVWIEITAQGGIILQGTHFHTIFRDKNWDYGNAL